MIELRSDQREAVRRFFPPDRPGPQAGLHAIQTGMGSMHVDRWPEPRVVVAFVGDDVQLGGDAAAVDADDLRSLGLDEVMIDAAAEFVPALEAAFPELWPWSRVISTLEARKVREPEGVAVRRLAWDDARAIDSLPEDLRWISISWEGPEGLAASGLAFGAFAGERLVSVAAPFSMGDRYDDIGVVTDPDFRRRGINAACVAQVIDEIVERGRLPSWSTSPENTASLSVAAKFGARKHRDDVLYMLGFDEAP